MPCLLGCLAVAFPRLVILGLAIFTTYLGRAFQGDLLLPFLGFLFLPATTLAYAYTINTAGSVVGPYWALLVAGLLLDLGLLGGGAGGWRRWQRWRRRPV